MNLIKIEGTPSKLDAQRLIAENSDNMFKLGFLMDLANRAKVVKANRSIDNLEREYLGAIKTIGTVDQRREFYRCINRRLQN